MLVFARMKGEAASLCIRTRPLVCIRIIYGCVLLVSPVAHMLSFFNVIIVLERKVIILFIEVIQSALMCHCKTKKNIYSAANI
jgi:hypothetical protein